MDGSEIGFLGDFAARFCRKQKAIEFGRGRKGTASLGVDEMARFHQRQPRLRRVEDLGTYVAAAMIERLRMSKVRRDGSREPSESR